MRKIAELNMLLREQIALPETLKLATNEFREGWNFIQRSGARHLEKKILKSGWNFIRIADGSLRSGVGDTSQEAIANALKLALRRISTHFNAVEVQHIELTHYPWFFLARVRIFPFRIQEDAIFAVPDEPMATSIPCRAVRAKRIPAGSSVLFPDFGAAMPMMKQALVARASSVVVQ